MHVSDVTKEQETQPIETVVLLESKAVPPPAYADVCTDAPVEAKDEIQTESAARELFTSFATYCRIFVVLCIVFGIGLLVWYGIDWDAPEWALRVSASCLGVFYFVYITDVFCCGSNFKYLSNISLVKDIGGHVDSVRSSVPVIIWQMECYHMETHTRYVTEGSGDDKTERMETYTEKVVTWRGSVNFEYTRWTDVSLTHQLDRLRRSHHARIHFVKRYELADEATHCAFNQQKECFVDANRCRDVSYDITEVYIIPGFESNILACKTPDRPFFLRLRWYLLAVLFLLELPFSFMMKKQSSLVEYTYCKRLTYSC